MIPDWAGVLLTGPPVIAGIIPDRAIAELAFTGPPPIAGTIPDWAGVLFTGPPVIAGLIPDCAAVVDTGICSFA